jgi:hypothetical protein
MRIREQGGNWAEVSVVRDSSDGVLWYTYYVFPSKRFSEELEVYGCGPDGPAFLIRVPKGETPFVAIRKSMEERHPGFLVHVKEIEKRSVA